MTKIVEACSRNDEAPIFICDFSPARGADHEALLPARYLPADFISLAYNPGRSVRVNSAMAAYWVKEHIGREVVFTLAMRDMNKLSIQSILLGAQLLGLENVMAVKGDNFTSQEIATQGAVGDFSATDFIRSVNDMNEGLDFKGLKLKSPTDFCVGACMDLNKDIHSEIALTRRKVQSGSHFFITQPLFNAKIAQDLFVLYAEEHEEKLKAPVFFGIQIMSKNSVFFSDVPTWVTDDLEKGRSGVDIALEVYHGLIDTGCRSFYLIPPVLKGGRRDYEAAQAALEAFRE